MKENTQGSLHKLNSSMGSKIRALRSSQGLNITELAERTGLTPSMISQLERALISPSIATLKKICDALGIPISYLFEEAEMQLSGNANAPEAAGHLKAGEMAHTAAPAPMSALHLEAYLKMFSPANSEGISPVVHEQNRKFLSPGKGIRFYLLNPNLAGPIEFIYNEYDPGANTGRYSHFGSECGLILSGELVVEIKDKVYRLKKGDSITFDSSDPHLKRNDAGEVCTCVWANVPPWF